MRVATISGSVVLAAAVGGVVYAIVASSNPSTSGLHASGHAPAVAASGASSTSTSTSTTVAPAMSASSATNPAIAASSGIPTTTTTVATVAPSSIHIEVLNGSGAPGVATTTAAELAERGYDVVGTGDAASFLYTATSIVYPPGLEDEAAALAPLLTGAVQTTVSVSAPAGEVQLILGSAFTGLSNP